MRCAVILGCGYTGERVARRLLARGFRVVATTRSPTRLELPGAEIVRFDASTELDLSFVPEGSRLLYSIPALDPDPTVSVLQRLASRRPVRVVYLSTTSVYGSTRDVDEHSIPAPRTDSDHARVAAEQAVLSGSWSGLVLRPAAIYGPGRGVHVRMRAGTFRLAGDGSNYVSRIHVDDLAEICRAGLLSDITGAWPVADDHPCRSREIAEFCSRLLGLQMPEQVDPAQLHTTRRANRRVNGVEIRRVLGVTLRYPSYREGIPASV